MTTEINELRYIASRAWRWSESVDPKSLAKDLRAISRKATKVADALTDHWVKSKQANVGEY